MLDKMLYYNAVGEGAMCLSQCTQMQWREGGGEGCIVLVKMLKMLYQKCSTDRNFYLHIIQEEQRALTEYFRMDLLKQSTSVISL